MGTKSLLFFGGIPMEPDIKKLDEAFGVPGEGNQITWERMEQVLDLKRDTNRFKGIWTSWKKRLYREHNVVMCAIGNGQGVKCLNPDERISYAVNLSEQGGKKIRHAIQIAGTTDTNRLSNAEFVKAQLSVTKLHEAKLEIYRFVQPKQLTDAREALNS